MQAVVAQVQVNLCPHSAPSEPAILLKYGKALKSLQEAINGPSWQGPEVLCATQLLALFEVSWMQPLHCACLIADSVRRSSKGKV